MSGHGGGESGPAPFLVEEAKEHFEPLGRFFGLFAIVLTLIIPGLREKTIKDSTESTGGGGHH